MLDFIEDGQTAKGFIKAEPGLNNDVRFSYRPVLTHHRSQFFRESNALKAEQQDLMVAKLLAKQLVSWSLVDSKGKPVDLTEANVQKLRPAVFNRMFGIVVGSQPSDVDPEWSTNELATDATNRLESLLEDMSPGAAREHVEVKN